jgi:hypothetical protein
MAWNEHRIFQTKFCVLFARFKTRWVFVVGGNQSMKGLVLVVVFMNRGV